MVMTDTFTLIIVGILAAIAAFLKMRFSGKSIKRSPKPPKNTVADVARKISDEEFQEKLKAIVGDVEGDSPADDLASRGNARKR
jgi:hypothetical protein